MLHFEGTSLPIHKNVDIFLVFSPSEHYLFFIVHSLQIISPKNKKYLRSSTDKMLGLPTIMLSCKLNNSEEKSYHVIHTQKGIK